MDVTGQAAMAKHIMTNEPGRRRGGQPGNTNARKHGRRSAAAELARKQTTATLKGITHLLVGLGEFPPGQRRRCRPMRVDQLGLTARLEPELFDYLMRYGRPKDVVGRLMPRTSTG